MRYIYTLTVLCFVATITALSIPELREKTKERRPHQYGIINGTYADIADYPYTAAFLLEGSLWGAGAILNKKWILTSAFNCLWIYPKFITIRVGSDNSTEGGQLMSIDYCILHPNYVGEWNYDIAVIKVSDTIKFNKNVKRIKFGENPKTDATGDLTGWGVVDSHYKKQTRLQHATVNVVNKTTCDKAYGNSSTNTNFCSYNTQTGPCVFDFGDPLVQKKQLVGLYIGSTDCTKPETYPVLYTNISSLAQWVRKTIKNQARAQQYIVCDD